MGVLDIFRRGPEPSPEQSLEKVLQDYNLVAVDDTPGHQFMVVTEKGKQASDPSLKTSPGYREMGNSQPSPYSGWAHQEYNNDMRGILGFRNIEKMRRSDGTVQGVLRTMKTPVLAGRWYMEPASDSARDEKVAKEVWDNLQTMSHSWTQVLTESLLMADFGYYMFEKVWMKDPKTGQDIWQKLAPRHPMDVDHWEFDANGGPNGVWMQADDAHKEPYFIPIEKLLVFTFDKEADNMEGRSVLRPIWKHYYYKENLYKIDAIQKERHGIGIPIIKLPPNFSKEDKTLAEDIGRNLRTNERAHIVFPPNWDIMFAKLEGHPVDLLKSIEHHDMKIKSTILAPFIDNPDGTKEDEMTLFLKGARFLADIVMDTFNDYAIPQWVDYNYERGLKGYPKLKVRRVGEQADWRTQSFMMRNLVGAGIIIPDDKLEEWSRKEFDLPPADPTTARLPEPKGDPEAEGDGKQGAPAKGNDKVTGQTPPDAKSEGAGTGVDRSGK